MKPPKPPTTAKHRYNLRSTVKFKPEKVEKWLPHDTDFDYFAPDHSNICDFDELVMKEILKKLPLFDLLFAAKSCPQMQLVAESIFRYKFKTLDTQTLNTVNYEFEDLKDLFSIFGKYITDLTFSNFIFHYVRNNEKLALLQCAPNIETLDLVGFYFVGSDLAIFKKMHRLVNLKLTYCASNKTLEKFTFGPNLELLHLYSVVDSDVFATNIGNCPQVKRIMLELADVSIIGFGDLITKAPNITDLTVESCGFLYNEIFKHLPDLMPQLQSLKWLNSYGI